MISRIHIKNFKSLIDNDIAINKLTLLTGLNSSGKSSLIQTVRMLNNLVTTKVPFIPELGRMRELINKNSNKFTIEAYTELNDLLALYSYNTSNNVEIAESSSIKWPNVMYVEAGRFGSRLVIPVDENKDSFSSNGDNILYFINQHSEDIVESKVIHKNAEGNTLLYNIRAWLKEISPNLNFDYQILPQMNSSYSKFDEYRAVNVGFGLSYALPVIVALLYATINKNTLLLLENPEAHLHPKGQAMIAQLICKSVEAGAQVIVETHSDHLFDGVRVYAKNHVGFSKNVALHWFYLNKENTEITTPTLDDNGRLDKWPEDMFEQFEINASDLL